MSNNYEFIVSIESIIDYYENLKNDYTIWVNLLKIIITFSSGFYISLFTPIFSFLDGTTQLLYIIFMGLVIFNDIISIFIFYKIKYKAEFWLKKIKRLNINKFDLNNLYRTQEFTKFQNDTIWTFKLMIFVNIFTSLLWFLIPIAIIFNIAYPILTGVEYIAKIKKKISEIDNQINHIYYVNSRHEAREKSFEKVMKSEIYKNFYDKIKKDNNTK